MAKQLIFYDKATGGLTGTVFLSRDDDATLYGETNRVGVLEVALGDHSVYEQANYVVIGGILQKRNV